MLSVGDKLYSAKRYGRALEQYTGAFALDKRRLELLYKLGLCHGVLGNRAQRMDQRSDAINHYKRAIEFWTKASRLDPYNKGAKANIMQAQKKLASLQRG